jgi:hypothetical protein
MRRHEVRTRCGVPAGRQRMLALGAASGSPRVHYGMPALCRASDRAVDRESMGTHYWIAGPSPAEAMAGAFG